MKRAAVFATLLAWCGALLALRVVRANSGTFFFLTWNLFLAVVPFVAAEVYARAR